MRPAIILILLLTIPALATAQPGEKPASARTMTVSPVSGGQNVTVSFSQQGTPLSEFLDHWSTATGLNFFYPENLFRGRTVVGLGVVTVNRAELDFLFQSMLVRNGYALVPAGPPEASLYSIEAIDSSRSLKQNAAWVTPEQVPDLARRPAEVFMTSLTLKHVKVSQVRQGLNQILANRNVEFIHEVQSSNSLVMVGFGPTLASIQSLAAAIDVEYDDPDQKRAPVAPGKPR